jgi:hypothetical protein
MAPQVGNGALANLPTMQRRECAVDHPYGATAFRAADASSIVACRRKRMNIPEKPVRGGNAQAVDVNRFRLRAFIASRDGREIVRTLEALRRTTDIDRDDEGRYVAKPKTRGNQA